MKHGDVILTPVPQADGRIKNRPAHTGVPVRKEISPGRTLMTKELMA